MIDSVIFIGAIIIALTQIVKILAPTISGVLTIVVAVVIGIVVALVDKSIGVTDISVAQGILIALSAVGVHTTAAALNTGTTPKV